jgi:acyl-coenzyme A thioesterase PaaI-like protein
MRSLLPTSEQIDNLKLSALINAYCAVNIPLLAFVTPRVVSLTDERAEVRIRLDRRSRNHLGVMYFGALAMGAELSIALKALTAINQSGKRIDFIFKDFSAEFLKRADGHVQFVCPEAAQVQDLINRSAATSERLSQTFNGFAFVPSNAEEPVMKYKLTLSVKQRERKLPG